MLSQKQIGAIREKDKKGPRSPIDHILSGLPTNTELHQKAVKFAGTMPGKLFGHHKLASVLKVSPAHALKIGSELLKAGKVSRGKFKGKPAWIGADTPGIPEPLE